MVQPADPRLEALIDLLGEARARGLVGPGPVGRQVDHARGFAEAVGKPPSGETLDLGSGAGLPGLVLALLWPASGWVLLDGRVRSRDFLLAAVESLGLEERVAVVLGRAETVAHQLAYRGRFSLVVSRGLGPPAVTAECAAGFLAEGGKLVVSEPPGSTGARWHEGGLGALGMAAREIIVAGGGSFAVLTQRTIAPSRFPRRAGIPAKRPLF